MARFLALILALLIAGTTQQMAVARGMAFDAGDQVIPCTEQGTGQGVATVPMNMQGEPVVVVHFCPDCALTLMAAASTPTQLEPLVFHSQTLTQTPVTVVQITISPTTTRARGPPRSV